MFEFTYCLTAGKAYFYWQIDKLPVKDRTSSYWSGYENKIWYPRK